MKSNTHKNKQSIVHFLSASGLLQSGKQDEIVKARKEYWKKYRSEWRKNFKKNKKSFTIDFTFDEHQRIKAGASIHHRSITKFIKESSLAYCQQEHLIPDPLALNFIREQLIMNYNLILNLADENHISKNLETSLIEKLSNIEIAIIQKLNLSTPLPKLIEEQIE